MKDEIKKILDRLRNCDYDDFNKVLDYITNLQDTLKDREEYCYGLETELTNLQEEVKSANESITWWQNRFNAIQQENINIKQQLLENKISLKDIEYKEKIKLQERIDKVKIEISALMSKYFYEKYFCIEDTHLDKLLRIIDGDNILEGDDKDE